LPICIGFFSPFKEVSIASCFPNNLSFESRESSF